MKIYADDVSDYMAKNYWKYSLWQQILIPQQSNFSIKVSIAKMSSDSPVSVEFRAFNRLQTHLVLFIDHIIYNDSGVQTRQKNKRKKRCKHKSCTQTGRCLRNLRAFMFCWRLQTGPYVPHLTFFFDPQTFFGSFSSTLTHFIGQMIG